MLFGRVVVPSIRRGLRQPGSSSSSGGGLVMLPKYQTRTMAGGKYMTVSQNHALAGEFFGVLCWLWVFHRARHDLAVVYGFRHPWEHGDGDHDDHHHY